MAVQLAEVIAQLRAELTEAMSGGAGEALRFELGPIEVELTVTVEKEAEAGAKVRFWVVDASANGRLTTSGGQRIKLTLDPRARDQPLVRPLISGAAEPDER